MFRNLCLPLAALILFAAHAYAQAPAAPDSAKTYHHVETTPVFPGGMDAFKKLLRGNPRYSQAARRAGVQGKVFIGFEVDTAGHTTNIAVKQGLHPDLDAEAVRFVRRLEQIQWQPGRQNGRPVTVSYTVPMNFSLPQQGGTVADSLDSATGAASIVPFHDWATARKTIPSDRGVVYGECLQRLGFSSGGFAQYVRLVNLDTHKAVRINVKPAFKSRQANSFCYALPPGRYALHSYEYTDSKWYGGVMHAESLRKSAALDAPLTAARYVFTVLPGQLHYVGTWDFSQPQPVFLNQKAAFDTQLNKEIDAARLDAATVAVPK
jgi:TonB family protein